MTDYRPSETSRQILLGDSGTLKIGQATRQVVSDGPATMQILSATRLVVETGPATMQIPSTTRSTLLGLASTPLKLLQAIRLVVFPGTKAIHEQLQRLVAHGGTGRLQTLQAARLIAFQGSGQLQTLQASRLIAFEGDGQLRALQAARLILMSTATISNDNTGYCSIVW